MALLSHSRYATCKPKMFPHQRLCQPERSPVVSPSRQVPQNIAWCLFSCKWQGGGVQGEKTGKLFAGAANLFPLGSSITLVLLWGCNSPQGGLCLTIFVLALDCKRSRWRLTCPLCLLLSTSSCINHLRTIKVSFSHARPQHCVTPGFTSSSSKGAGVKLCYEPAEQLLLTY